MKTTLRLNHVAFETHIHRIVALGLLAVLLLLAVTGCKHEARTTVDLKPAGDYALISVDGKAVPCSLTHEGTAMTIKSGVFTFNSDASCRSQITFAVPSRADLSREVKATYTRQGSELTMKWEGAGTTKGNLKGDQFTMTNEGMVFAYRK